MLKLPKFMKPDLMPGSAMLIGLVGRKNSGKTTAAELIKDDFKDVTFAEPVKRIVEITHGFSYDMLLGDTPEKRERRNNEHDPIWNQTPVQAMQFIGTDLYRNHFDKNIWINIAKRKIDDIMKTGQNVVITDCRFENEIEFIRKQGGRILVLYENPDDIKPIKKYNINTFIYIILSIMVFIISWLFLESLINHDTLLIINPRKSFIVKIASTIGIVLTSYLLIKEVQHKGTASHASENSFQNVILPSDFYYHNKKEGVDKMASDLVDILASMK